MRKSWTGNNRAPWHDYKSPCKYHITLMKAPGIAPFGNLAGRCDIPVGMPGSPYIEPSVTGRGIKRALYRISEIDSRLRLLQYALMPDHLHLFISIEEQLDEHLGKLIARFKIMVNEMCGFPGIFEEGYNDQIITPKRDFDTIFRYIRENPYRLAVRHEHPEYFNRVQDIAIAGRRFSTYGNIALLKNPFKEQVVVHRKDSESERRANSGRWMHVVANGGVLVSPFISKAEKEIRQLAEAIAGKIILITNDSLGEREKPAAHDFERCAKGELLLLTPTQPTIASPLSREGCITMNAIAATLCAR